MSLFNRLSLIQRAPHQHGDAQADTVLEAAASNSENRNEGNGRNNNRFGSVLAAGRSGAGNNNVTTKNASKISLEDVEAKAGVLLKTLKPGDATNYPKMGDTCTIHYDAFTEQEISSCNPISFDSSRSRGQMFHFRLGAGQVIEGLNAAVSKMSVGQEVEATIPYPYAYGVAGFPPVVPPRTTLIFRVELIRFSSIV